MKVNERKIENNLTSNGVIQLTINFEAGLAESFETCRELLSTRVHQQKKLMRYVAADMNMSPPKLSRKLNQPDGDTTRFTLDDFELWLGATGDLLPLHYLYEKYSRGDDPEQIKKTIKELEAKVKRLEGRK
jgi:hypothetical protein